MSENKFLVFLSRYGFTALLVVALLATSAFWLERHWRAKQRETRQDFLTLQQMQERFARGEQLPLEWIEKAEAIVARHPELHPQYDSLLIYSLSAHAKYPEAAHYTAQLLERHKHRLPREILADYQDYGAISLLIAEGHESSAYAESSVLQARLSGQSERSLLEAMNLLRLCFLAEKLHETQGYAQAWQQLQQHPCYRQIQPLFQEGNLSLEDYCRLGE